MRPSKDEVHKFLDVFYQLNEFEAHHRTVRGWGCYEENQLPIPEVVSVFNWLKEEFDLKDNIPKG